MAAGAYLIDPDARTVEPAELHEGDFLDLMRENIGAPQVNVVATAEGRIGVWYDQMGMLRPNRAFWRFGDSDHRFAGRCVITGLEAGRPAPLPPVVTAEAIREQVVFYGPETLERIVEELTIVQDEDGRPVPAVVRRVVWKEEIAQIAQPIAQIAEIDGWTIFERDDGTYRVVGFRLHDDGRMETVSLFTAPNLDEARRRLPAGLTRLEPIEGEPNTVLEHWK